MGQDQDEQPFPLMGWLTVGTLLVLSGIFLWVVRGESKESPAQDASTLTSYEETMQLVVADLEQSYPVIEHSDPVARRQIHYLRKHLAFCAAGRLTASLPAAIPRTTSDGKIHDQMKSYIQERSSEAHSVCADMLLDQFLQDAPAARLVAQSIKACGVPLNASYAGVSSDWPEKMGEGRMARMLAKSIGP